MNFNVDVQSKLENVGVLWHQGPAKWQGSQSGQESYADLAGRFLYLMGNENGFKLVLSILGPESKHREEGFSTDNEKLTEFLSALDNVGIHPTLVYHPDVQKASGDWSGDELAATVDDMIAFNNYIRSYNSELPVFSEYLLEGKDFGKDANTMLKLRTLVDSKLGDNTELWFTGDWHEGVTLDSPSTYSKNASVPDNGVYMQLYNMVGTDLYGKQTNPGQAEQLGKDFVDSLTGQHGWNPQVFSYPNRAIQAFTFYDQGFLTDAPGFYGRMASEPWDLNDFNTFTESFLEEFDLHSTQQSPLLSIWYAENALTSLSPDPSFDLQVMFGSQSDAIRTALGL